MIESNASPQSSVAGLKGMGGKKGKGSLKAGLFAKFLALFQKHMGQGGLAKGAQNNIQGAQAAQKSQALNKGMMGKQVAVAVEPGQGLTLMVNAPGLKGGEIKFASMKDLQTWLQDHPDAVVMMEPEVGSDASVAEAFMAAMEEIDVEEGNGLGDPASVVQDSSADILVGLSLVSREKVSNVVSLVGAEGASEKSQLGQTKGNRADALLNNTGNDKGERQLSNSDGKEQKLTESIASLSTESDKSGKSRFNINQSQSNSQKFSADIDAGAEKVAIDIQSKSKQAQGVDANRMQAGANAKLDAMGQLLANADVDRAVADKLDVDSKSAVKVVQQSVENEQLKGKRAFDGAADLPTHLAQLKADRNGVQQQQSQAAPVAVVDRAVAAVSSDQGLGTSQQDLGSSSQDTNAQLLADNSKADAKSLRAADFAAQLAYKTPKAFRPADAMLEIARSARDGSVKIELQLDPANLGKIQVTLQTDAAKQLQVHFVVDQAMSRQALEQNMPQLRQALAEQGLDLGSFSMSMNSQGQGGDSQGSGGSEGRGGFGPGLLQGSQNNSQETVRMGVNLANDGGLSLMA